MDNLTSVTLASMRDKGVEKHLVDLRNRFRELRKRHDAIVENSINIIREIGQVSMKLNTFKTKDNDCGFENALGIKLKKGPTVINIQQHFDDTKIVDSFEKLNQSNTLQNSLLLLNRTKDSMRIIDEFLAETTKGITCCGSKDLWSEKNFDSNTKSEYPMHNFDGVTSTLSGISVKSCFSSSISLDGFKSIEDFGESLQEGCCASPSFCDVGYQGDLDESEHDLHDRRKIEK